MKQFNFFWKKINCAIFKKYVERKYLAVIKLLYLIEMI